MAYFDSYLPPEPITGTFNRDFNPNVPGIRLADILTNTDIPYAGQSIRIREQIRVNCQVVDASLVDIDLRWSVPLRFLGTWQIAGLLGFDAAPGSYGRIQYESTTLTRDHLISFVANPNYNAMQAGIIAINQCNLSLIPADVMLPNGNVVNGYRTDNKEPIFTATLYRQGSNVVSDVFETECNFIGIHLYKGVVLSSLTYSIYPVGLVPILDAPAAGVTCSLGGCNEEFIAFIIAQFGAPLDTPGGGAYSTLSGCQAQFGTCAAYTYNCVNGESRSYYSSIPT